MYNILICDDNTEYIKLLKRTILKTGISEHDILFKDFSSGEMLVDYLSSSDAKCDLLILDMQLPGMDGDETAAKFRKYFPDSVLVFCSGVCHPTDKSFKVMAFRYIYKSYSDEQILVEISEIIKKMVSNKAEPLIAGRYHNKTVILRPDDIIYIEIIKHGSRIHICPQSDYYEFEDGLITNDKLSYLYEQLKDSGFAYAHNSYIVNMKYIRKTTASELFFIKWSNEESEKSLSISRSKSNEFRKCIAEWLSKKY